MMKWINITAENCVFKVLRFKNIVIVPTLSLMFIMVILQISHMSIYRNATVKYVSNGRSVIQTYAKRTMAFNLANTMSNEVNTKSSYFTTLKGHNRTEYYFGSWRLIYDGPQIENIIAFKGTTVAIGMGITSKQGKLNTSDNKFEQAKTFLFFTIFLPSFCKTASAGFKYRFFLAFDNDDKYFRHKSNLGSFKTQFNTFVSKNCMNKSTYELYFIETTHSGKPARAQNDAMMAAYMLNHDYYYRINDDTTFSSSNWTRRFIDALNTFNPPNVGVVGPHHFGGNPSILTYDFVHKSHVDIHGFYYPTPFTDWFADNWITDVYKPNRTLKLKDIQLLHSGSGSRYKYNGTTARYLQSAIDEGKRNIQRFIKYTRKNQGTSYEKEKIIAFFLGLRNGSSLYGTLRNIQLAKLFFPQWKPVIYTLQNAAIPEIFLYRLKTMEVQVYSLKMSTEMSKLPLYLLKYLLIDDLKEKTYFMLRDVSTILTENDITQTEMWLKNQLPVYCINKNTTGSNSLVLLGGKNPVFFKRLKTDSIRSALLEIVHSREMDLDENSVAYKILFSNPKTHKECFH